MEPNTDPTPEAIAQEPLLQLFCHQHLPPQLRDVVRPFCELALRTVSNAPRNPERSTCLRKLREAKDCAVTATLWKDPPR